jgi:hypothetical protein
VKRWGPGKRRVRKYDKTKAMKYGTVLNPERIE